eukprot:TRINITY_DN57838_c0_g1_i1.p1 TRINITY_DN57838_c0_g1~~TRINITY_DN57838_c0_g1_i1.p1  ORF type:complete len:148 (+),score=40.01 TRINITY_DN57838_c0_g1_i1:66-509(+)
MPSSHVAYAVCAGGIAALALPAWRDFRSRQNSAAMIQVARNYYDAFNEHDLSKLKTFFLQASELEDKNNGHLTGYDAVVKAHADVLGSVPNIHFHVVALHPSLETNTMLCELKAKLNDDAKTELRIVDVLEFFPDMQHIKSLRAYDG